MQVSKRDGESFVDHTRKHGVTLEAWFCPALMRVEKSFHPEANLQVYQPIRSGSVAQAALRRYRRAAEWFPMLRWLWRATSIADPTNDHLLCVEPNRSCKLFDARRSAEVVRDSNPQLPVPKLVLYP